jgi:hypothetical protein
MSLKRIFMVCLFCPALLLAGNPFVDNSKASADGPYVLFRGKQIVVKNVVMRDTTPVMDAQVYNVRADVQLRCQVGGGPESFAFPLHAKHDNDPTQYAQPEQMLVVSDIEGNFRAFKLMLLGAKVMDKDFKWTFGKGHLVLLGDFFDRGLNVTECLWLIYKLEAEAEAAGGKVHFILGNHEILNLEGKTQYVRKKYLENAAILQEDYARLYDNNSELGRWLRSKNAVEKIGSYVFCHGGISPELSRSRLSLEEINRLSRQFLGIPNEAIVQPEAALVFDQRVGIFWYRGIAKNVATEEEVTQVLKFAKAKRMVLGHTLQTDITALYNGRVICIDLYHEENLRQGLLKTLWVEDGFCYSLDSRGEKSSVFSIQMPKKASPPITEGH